MSESTKDIRTYSAMQEGKPIASYRKTILGKVYINILDPFTGNPSGVILSGQANSEEARVDVWTIKENLFLQRMNRKHFETGVLLKIELPLEKLEEIAGYTDAELKEILNSVYISLQKKLVEIEDPAILNRMVDLASELKKSEKIVGAVEGRLQEVLSVEG